MAPSRAQFGHKNTFRVKIKIYGTSHSEFISYFL